GCPARWGCARPSCAGCAWTICTSTTDRWARSMSGWARARGSGPRERLVPMLGDARPLLVWWVSQVRGEFGDDFDRPWAPLFPSERGGPADDDTFRLALAEAAARHLRGSVRTLGPHVLRHAC